MDRLLLRDRKLVVAALCQRRGRVLITQRRADQAMPLKWELPGGKVEAGESPTGALVREMREEVGVTGEAGPIYDVVFHAYPNFDLYLLIYHFVTDQDPQCIEVADLAWALPREFDQYDFLPADEPIFARLRRELG